MQRAIVMGLLAWAGALVAPAAIAGFHAERAPPAPVPAFDVIGFTPVTQIGTGLPAQVEGFGQRVPLPEAMRMLLPDGWSYAPGANVGTDAISWSARSTWLEVLHQIGELYRLRFLVDWRHQVVYAEPFRPATAGAPTPARAVNAEWPAADALTWGLVTGGLRVQLNAWAERANYHLFWPEDIGDITIQVPVTLRGEFLEAIEKVGRALDAVGAGVKLHPYPENRALVIEEY